VILHGSQNVLFVRVPKCATIWTEGVIQAAGIPHERSARDPRFNFGPRHVAPWAVTSPYSAAFALVRHPLRWYESKYRYQAGRWAKGLPGRHHPCWPLIGIEGASFHEFMERVLEREPGFVTRLYEYMLGPAQAPTVDVVVRLEHVVDELPRAFAQLGLGACEPRRAPAHTSFPHDVTWRDDLRARVLATEASAIRRFYPDVPHG